MRELVRRNGASLMQPHCDYVLVGRRVALSRDFGAMGEELGSALKRLDAQLSKRKGQKPRLANLRSQPQRIDDGTS